MGDERSRSAGAGTFATHERTGDRPGTRLAAGGDGKPAGLLDRRTGAALRSQHHVGGAPVGVGGVIAGGSPATSAGRPDRRPDRHAFPGAGGARQRRALSADGAGFRRATVDHAASRRTLPSLAQSQYRGARAHPGRTQAVSESATAAYHAGKGTGPDRRHRPTSAGAPGIAAAKQRTAAAEDPTRHPVVDRTGQTNRGASTQPC